MSVVVGSEKKRRAALSEKADIYIINRENLVWLVEKSGIDLPVDMLVIDELSSFKTYQSKRTKTLMKLRLKVQRVVGLSGTPAPNGLMDLFAEYKVLDMGYRLGRYITDYRKRYFLPDKTNGRVVFSYKPRPFAEEMIYQKISDMTISMRSGDYLQMPEKMISQCVVEMSPEERKQYQQLKKNLILQLEGDMVTAKNAASLSGKLSQMANGAVYTDEGSVFEFHQRKLDALEDMIEAANGKPVLVAYWFQHDLERISQRLQDKKISFEKLDSAESMERWNAGKLPVALIHPASAGHGLNLQEGGSTIIWFGLTWSLELYQQTNGRLWRQGQKDQTVVIHHIITAGSIDEKILTALNNKNTTQESIISAVKAQLQE